MTLPICQQEVTIQLHAKSRSGQWEEQNLSLPLPFAATLCEEQDIFNCPSDCERSWYVADPGHWQILFDSLQSISSHGLYVVGHNDTFLGGGPCKNGWIICTDQSHILDPYKVERRRLAQDSTEDIVVKIFVGQKTDQWAGVPP